jgi:D-arginine utilization repressor
MKKKATSPVRKLLLERYSHVAESTALLFFPYAEVVIHDLSTQTIAYIANNLSKREIGDDSALEEIEHTVSDKIVGPYEKLNWDGRKMRCVSTVLFDDTDAPVGMMCTNFNIAVIDDVRGILDGFMKGVGVVPQPDELFRDDWQERINSFLHAWLAERQLSLNSLSRPHRRELVEALYLEGAFKGKSAANYVANVLGMGRATVFKHLKDLRGA